MLNMPILKFEKSTNYLNSQLDTQKNNKSLVLDIIANVGLISNSVSVEEKETYSSIVDAANEFLNEISGNITTIEQLLLEISNITDELSNLLSEEAKNTKTKEFYIAAFSNVKHNMLEYSKKFQNVEEKLENDNNNFNEFINENNFKYTFDTVKAEGEEKESYTFTGFSVNNTTFEDVESFEDIANIVENKNTSEVLKENSENTNVENSTEIDLNEINLDDIDVEDLDLNEADLEDINLDDIDVEDLELNEADLEDINLDDIDVEDLELNEADLENINLDDIDVEDLDLNEVDLEDINLDDIDVEDLDLNEVDLEDINLNNIDVNDLEETSLDENTIEENVSNDTNECEIINEAIDNSDEEICDSFYRFEMYSLMQEHFSKSINLQKYYFDNTDEDTYENEIVSETIQDNSSDIVPETALETENVEIIEEIESVESVDTLSGTEIQSNDIPQEIVIEQENIIEEYTDNTSDIDEQIYDNLLSVDDLDENLVSSFITFSSFDDTNTNINGDSNEETTDETTNTVINDTANNDTIVSNLLNSINSNLDEFDYLFDKIDNVSDFDNDEEIDEIFETNDINDITIESEISNDIEEIVETDYNSISVSDNKEENTISKINEMIENILSAKSDNFNLIFSEKTNSIYLPYSSTELVNYINSYPDSYNSLQDVVKQEFVLPLNYFSLRPSKSRFSEGYNLMKNREGNNFLKSVSYAAKLITNKKLNPAIIAACKTQNELDSYLYYLENGNVDNFKYFNITYDVNPL